MYKPSEQHGDLACETDVVHRSYGLSCQTHPSQLSGDGGLGSRASEMLSVISPTWVALCLVKEDFFQFLSLRRPMLCGGML